MPTVPVVVPSLETKRLLLRQTRREDFEPYADHMADPVVTQHMSGVMDRRMAWRTFSALSGTWLINGAGWWAIEVKESKSLVGIVGAFYRHSPLAEGRPGDIELGWSVFRPHWRHGYASEAAREAQRFAFESHGAPRAIAHIDPTNTASLGVSRALGMVFVANVDFYGFASTMHAIDRPST